MQLLNKYFPRLTTLQQEQFSRLFSLYSEWNEKINLVSRKDIDFVYERHVLHSLGIAKVIRFKPGTKVLDIGTGGGFPGIPLALMFPECDFLLIDSIGKKIKVVNAVKEALGLSNVRAEQGRAEAVEDKYDFVVCRAVASLSTMWYWVSNKIKLKEFNDLPNGLISLKGGELKEELESLGRDASTFHLSEYFEEEFFELKKIVHVPARS